MATKSRQIRPNPNVAHHVRVRKTEDPFILSYVNTHKSKPNTQMDDSDERGDSFALEKLTSVDEREKIVKSPVRNKQMLTKRTQLGSGTERNTSP